MARRALLTHHPFPHYSSKTAGSAISENSHKTVAHHFGQETDQVAQCKSHPSPPHIHVFCLYIFLPTHAPLQTYPQPLVKRLPISVRPGWIWPRVARLFKEPMRLMGPDRESSRGRKTSRCTTTRGNEGLVPRKVEGFTFYFFVAIAKVVYVGML